MDDEVARIVKEGMEEFHMLIKLNIFNGSTKPNAPATVRKKGFNSPLWETGELFNSIKVLVTDIPNGIHGEAGLLETGTELWEITMMNELGGITDPDNPPERPAFREAYDANSERVLGKMEHDILDHLESLL